MSKLVFNLQLPKPPFPTATCYEEVIITPKPKPMREEVVTPFAKIQLAAVKRSVAGKKSGDDDTFLEIGLSESFRVLHTCVALYRSS